MAVTNNAANNAVLNNFQTIENQAVSTAGSQLSMIKNRALGTIVTGDTIGTIQFTAFDGTQNTVTSQINSVSSGTIASLRVASDLEFYTHPDSVTVSTQRMVIASTGAVSINTPDSGNALTVSGKTETTTFQMTNGATNTYILTSDAAGNGTWTAPSAVLFAYTNVNTTPYVVLSTDYYLSVDSSGGAITVQLPNAPSTGRVFIIKDRTGSAATHNITVTTVGGAVNIDGATSFVMNTNLESIEVVFSGSAYEVF